MLLTYDGKGGFSFGYDSCIGVLVASTKWLKFWNEFLIFLIVGCIQNMGVEHNDPQIDTMLMHIYATK